MEKDKEQKTKECCCQKDVLKRWHGHHHSGPNPLYGLGVIGALFYFLQGATTLREIIIGVGKAIFWPALLLFRILTDLRM